MKHEHKNHRERLRKRFLETGLRGFAPHEVLELILFYSLPQQDTNAVAHRLVNHFGSFSAVLDAPASELMRVSGIKEMSAALIKLIPAICSYYHIDKTYGGKTFVSIEDIAEYCMYKTVGETRERFYVMIFDSTMRLLAFEAITEGSHSEVEVNLEHLAQILFRYSGSNFILVHNHPGGSPAPSEEDILLTERIYSVTAPLGRHLIEHLIISKNRYIPIMQSLRSRGYDFYSFN
jgi:DNA repair protein RadC